MTKDFDNIIWSVTLSHERLNLYKVIIVIPFVPKGAPPEGSQGSQKKCTVCKEILKHLLMTLKLQMAFNDYIS